MGLDEHLWACGLAKGAALSQAKIIMVVQHWCQGYAQELVAPSCSSA